MLTFDDKGVDQKIPKTCLRNIWMFPSASGGRILDLPGTKSNL